MTDELSAFWADNWLLTLFRSLLRLPLSVPGLTTGVVEVAVFVVEVGELAVELVVAGVDEVVDGPVLLVFLSFLTATRQPTSTTIAIITMPINMCKNVLPESFRVVGLGCFTLVYILFTCYLYHKQYAQRLQAG